MCAPVIPPGHVDRERDRQAPSPGDQQPVARGLEHPGRTAPRSLQGPQHRDHSVAERDQDETAEELGPQLAGEALPPAHPDRCRTYGCHTTSSEDVGLANGPSGAGVTDKVVKGRHCERQLPDHDQLLSNVAFDRAFRQERRGFISRYDIVMRFLLQYASPRTDDDPHHPVGTTSRWRNTGAGQVVGCGFLGRSRFRGVPGSRGRVRRGSAAAWTICRLESLHSLSCYDIVYVMNLDQPDFEHLLTLRTGLERFLNWTEQEAKCAGIRPQPIPAVARDQRSPRSRGANHRRGRELPRCSDTTAPSG